LLRRGRGHLYPGHQRARRAARRRGAGAHRGDRRAPCPARRARLRHAHVARCAARTRGDERAAVPARAHEHAARPAFRAVNPSRFQPASWPRGLSLRRLLSLGLATLAVLLPACAYKLGPTSGVPAGSRSIAILPFENQTMEPRVTASLVNALRAQLQQEGHYLLSRRDEADVVLTGEVAEISRREQSFFSEDPRILRDYRLEIVAKVRAVERGTGRVLL